jgi:hypothetical protein
MCVCVFVCVCVCVCVCVLMVTKKVKFEQERNKSFAVQSVRISSEGRITAIVTIFGERKFRRTLENFNRHCNYLLYYGIRAS